MATRTLAWTDTTQTLLQFVEGGVRESFVRVGGELSRVPLISPGVHLGYYVKYVPEWTKWHGCGPRREKRFFFFLCSSVDFLKKSFVLSEACSYCTFVDYVDVFWVA